MYDLIIKNGNIIDGTGEAPYCEDIAIKDGKIVKIQKNLSGAHKIIDATNLSVTPGFIDSHSHSDTNMITFPHQREKTEQGITTSIAGQCGFSLYPTATDGKFNTMGEFIRNNKDIRQGSNTAFFVGHRQLRKSVMGMENREPTKDELEDMKYLLKDAVENGALGVSFGLIYTPSCYAKTEELIELAKVSAECNGLVAAHIRNESDNLIDAVEEFITIIKKSGATGVLSHHKAAFKKNHGKVVKTLKMIEDANEEGFEIYCDVYPYIASSTSLAARFIPAEYCKETEKIVSFLEDEELCKKFKEENISVYGTNLDWVQINNCPGYPEYEFKTIKEIADECKKDEYDVVFDILRKCKGICMATYFSMCEEDVKAVLKYPRTMICTDSEVAGNKTSYHPRLRGSFPRVLGKYVREEKVTSLCEMIRKMTSLPASVYGLKTKGVIAEGFDADICIFDADKIKDNATFEDCSKKATGLNYVIVNGTIVAEDATANDEMPGKMILRR